MPDICNDRNTPLQREVKKDGRGFYINFGGCRLRPNPPDRTRFNLGEEVSMTIYDMRTVASARVFKYNEKEREIWRTIWSGRPVFVNGPRHIKNSPHRVFRIPGSEYICLVKK